MQPMIRFAFRTALLPVALALLLPTFAAAQDVSTAKSWTEYAEILDQSEGAGAIKQEVATPERALGKAQVITTYPDRISFEAAHPAYGVEDFSSPLVPPASVISCLSLVNSTTNGPCYPKKELFAGVDYTSLSDAGLVALGDGFIGNPTTVFGPNFFADDFVMNFSPAVPAVGFDVAVLAGTTGSFDIKLTDTTGTITTWSFTPGVGTTIFFGASSPDLIVSIEINDDAYGGSEGELIDDLVFPVKPAVPVLLTPLNNAVDVPNTVDLRWEAADFATRYNVEVATDPLFANRVFHENVPGTQVTFHAPTQGTLYYWRVNSEGPGGNSTFAKKFNFTTELVIPAVPTLLTPLNGAVNVANVVDLRWTASEYADRYNVEVATDSQFKNKILHENVPLPRLTAFEAPTQGATYWWRANAEGQGGQSAYSAPFHFTTEVLKPGKPVLVFPADGAVDQPNDLDLLWNAAVNADRYDVQVFSDSSMSNQVFHENTPALTAHFTAPEAGGMYFWRVQAEGLGGSTASDLFRFSTSSTAGGSLVPFGLMPEDGATDVPVDPLMSWSAPDSAKSYWLQIATNETFENLVVDEDSIDGTSFQVMGLDYETQYCWRVAGVDGAGNSTFSASQTFTTVKALAPLGPVQLVSPADGATGVSATEPLTWMSLEGAEAYEVQVATDAGFTSLVGNDTTLTGTEYQTGTPYAYSTQHFWRVRAKNGAGWGEWSESRSFTTGTGVAIEETGEIPTEFAVSQNYPNPFNPSTKIEFAVPEATVVRITVFDALGRPVAVLVNDQLAAGYHTATWSPSGLVSGTYYYRIEAGRFVETRQMTLLK